MGLLVPIFVVVLGLASQILVEVSAELSSDVLLEGNAGVSFDSPGIVSDQIVDLRPETTLHTRITDLSPGW